MKDFWGNGMLRYDFIDELTNYAKNLGMVFDEIHENMLIRYDNTRLLMYIKA